VNTVLESAWGPWRGVLPRVPSWEVNANSGLTAAVLTAGVGPRYLSVCPNLNCPTNAVKFKMSECLMLPLFSVPNALDFPLVTA